MFICKQRYFYFFSSNPPAFYFIFLPNCPGWNLLCNVKWAQQAQAPRSFPDLREEAPSLSPSGAVLAVGFQMPCTWLRQFSSLLSLSSVLSQRALDLSNIFSASIEMITFLFFNLFTWCNTLIDLQTLKQLCIPRINPIWSWCIIHFICFWIRFVSILFRSFMSYS